MAREARYSEAAIIKEPAPFQALSGQAQPTLLPESMAGRDARPVDLEAF